MFCKTSIYITTTYIIFAPKCKYPSLTNVTACQKLPSPRYFSHFFINSNGIANGKTWSQFFSLRLTPPSSSTWSNTDVAEYVLDKIIKTLKEFQSVAIKRKNGGEKDLGSFLSK